MTAPAIAVEKLLIPLFQNTVSNSFITILLANILAVALVEEFFKYVAVWLKEQVINNNYELDESVDL